jgi:hypothetical protein
MEHKNARGRDSARPHPSYRGGGSNESARPPHPDPLKDDRGARHAHGLGFVSPAFKPRHAREDTRQDTSETGFGAPRQFSQMGAARGLKRQNDSADEPGYFKRGRFGGEVDVGRDYKTAQPWELDLISNLIKKSYHATEEEYISLINNCNLEGFKNNHNLLSKYCTCMRKAAAKFPSKHVIQARIVQRQQEASAYFSACDLSDVHDLAEIISVIARNCSMAAQNNPASIAVGVKLLKFIHSDPKGKALLKAYSHDYHLANLAEFVDRLGAVGEAITIDLLADIYHSFANKGGHFLQGVDDVKLVVLSGVYSSHLHDERLEPMMVALREELVLRADCNRFDWGRIDMHGQVKLAVAFESADESDSNKAVVKQAACCFIDKVWRQTHADVENVDCQRLERAGVTRKDALRGIRAFGALAIRDDKFVNLLQAFKDLLIKFESGFKSEGEVNHIIRGAGFLKRLGVLKAADYDAFARILMQCLAASYIQPSEQQRAVASARLPELAYLFSDAPRSVDVEQVFDYLGKKLTVLGAQDPTLNRFDFRDMSLILLGFCNDSPEVSVFKYEKAIYAVLEAVTRRLKVEPNSCYDKDVTMLARTTRNILMQDQPGFEPGQYIDIRPVVEAAKTVFSQMSRMVVARDAILIGHDSGNKASFAGHFAADFAVPVRGGDVMNKLAVELLHSRNKGVVADYFEGRDFSRVLTGFSMFVKTPDVKTPDVKAAFVSVANACVRNSSAVFGVSTRKIEEQVDIIEAMDFAVRQGVIEVKSYIQDLMQNIARTFVKRETPAAHLSNEALFRLFNNCAVLGGPTHIINKALISELDDRIHVRVRAAQNTDEGLFSFDRKALCGIVGHFSSDIKDPHYDAIMWSVSGFFARNTDAFYHPATLADVTCLVKGILEFTKGKRLADFSGFFKSASHLISQRVKRGDGVSENDVMQMHEALFDRYRQICDVDMRVYDSTKEQEKLVIALNLLKEVLNFNN